jgi:hypothetical protein
MHGRQVRWRPGVENEQAGTVFADHVLRERFAGGIRGHGYEALAEFVAYGAQSLLAASDADDAGTRGDERGGDRAPEAAAGTVTTTVWKDRTSETPHWWSGSVTIKTSHRRKSRRRSRNRGAM